MRGFISGTKELIFDKAIDIIASVGYENMSMRDLATSADIRVASVYNHYASKQDILDSIYDYYSEHMFDTRPPIEQSMRIFETGTKEEAFAALIFNFVTPDEKQYKRMLLITKIVMMRIFCDQRANNIFLQLNYSNPSEYVRKLLEFGISIGKIEPFDVETYANFVTGQIFFMGLKAFAGPDYAIQQLEEEKRILKMLMDFLPWKA